MNYLRCNYEIIHIFMHNIYALGGTVKAVSELANTLADKGHHIEIISVFELKTSHILK